MEIVRGVIRYFDPATYLAAVELGGSIATFVETIPVATNIRKEEMVVSRKCGVILFDPNNPSDACVAFVYGAVNPDIPKVADYVSSADLTLTTAAQDIPGCSATFTPPYACKALIIGTFTSQCSAYTALTDSNGRLMVDGTPEGPTAHKMISFLWDLGTATQVWVVSLSAAEHTLKLQAWKSVDVDTVKALSGRCVLLYVLLPNA